MIKEVPMFVVIITVILVIIFFSLQYKKRKDDEKLLKKLLNEEKEKNWRKINHGICPICNHDHKRDLFILEWKEYHAVVQCDSCRRMFWYGGNSSSIAYEIIVEPAS